MPISIDFSEIPGLDPIPEGEYPCEIVAATEGESAAGHPKIDLRWKVLVGEYENRMIFDHMSFAPNGLWRTKILLRSLGYEKDFAGDLDAEDLIGQSATLTVGIEEARTGDDGTEYPERNRVLRVNSLSATVDDLLD